MKQNDEGTLLIHLTAPPADGAANDQLVRFLANTLRLPRTNLRIASGTTSRDKRIHITGMKADLVRKLLTER